MTAAFLTRVKPHIGFALCFAFCAAILYVGLGDFGYFEPQETGRVEVAEQISEGRQPPRFPVQVSEYAAAASRSIFGDTERATRFPSTLFALGSAVLLYFVLLSFFSPSSAAFGVLLLAGSPLWMFHGRQLTGVAPALFADIASLGGLLIALNTESRGRRIAGISTAALGMGLGVMTRGIGFGIAAPAAAAALAGASSGFFSSGRVLTPKKITVLSLGALAIAAAGVLGATLATGADLRLITGPVSDKLSTRHNFEFALEQIVYSWFPLVVFAPLAVAGVFRNNAEPTKRAFARVAAVCGLLTAYAVQTIALDVGGTLAAVSVLPMVILILLSIEDLVGAERPKRLDVFIAAALLAVLIRDFAQNNQTLLYGYGVHKIPIPKDDYKPVILAGLFSIPTALLILYGFLPLRLRKRPLSWGLGAAAPVVFAVFISFFLIPRLSVHLSSKAGIEMAEKHRSGEERLAVFGITKSGKGVEKLNSLRAASDWLGKTERVFLLFPPEELAPLDRLLRTRSDKQAFVLEKAGERFMLAVSSPEEGEKNVSPLVGNVQSEPFDPPPAHETEVNFDDAVTLIGWRLESEGDINRLNRGQDLVFTSYWRVDGRIPGSYKMFMHFDGPGERMHGDHEVFGGEFPTDQWRKGDYVREVYRKKVPLYQPKGEYTVKIGLYNDKGRLKIKDSPSASENALTLTRTVIE